MDGDGDDNDGGDDDDDDGGDDNDGGGDDGDVDDDDDHLLMKSLVDWREDCSLLIAQSGSFGNQDPVALVAEKEEASLM